MASCRPRNTRTLCAASRRPWNSIPIASCTASSSAAPTHKWAETRTRESSSPRGSAWPRRRKTIRKPRILGGKFSRSSAEVLREFSQVRVNVEVVPKLRGHHGGKAALYGETRQRTRRHPAKSTPPVVHRGCVEITRAAQGFFAQELADERWLRIHVEAIQRRAEDHFAALVNGRRQPALRQ